MTAKRKITDKNGVQVFPITHTKAVYDDNGNSVEQRLQENLDLINQKQLEVGAVPSDTAPTEGSTNWVTSGGVKAALDNLSELVQELETNDEPQTIEFLDGSGYLNNNGNFASYGSGNKVSDFIAVTEGSKYAVSASSASFGSEFYCVWGYSSASESATTKTPFLEKKKSYIKEIITIPQGITYIRIAKNDGTPELYNTEYVSKIEKAEDEISAIDKKVDDLIPYTFLPPDIPFTIETEGYRFLNTSLSAAAGYVVTNYIPVIAGKKLHIVAAGEGNGSYYNGVWYNIDKTAVSAMTEKGLVQWNTKEITVPEGIAYIRLCSRMKECIRLYYIHERTTAEDIVGSMYKAVSVDIENGFMNTDGTISSATDSRWKRTSVVMHKGDKFKFVVHDYSTSNGGGSFLLSDGETLIHGNTGICQIPEVFEAPYDGMVYLQGGNGNNTPRTSFEVYKYDTSGNGGGKKSFPRAIHTCGHSFWNGDGLSYTQFGQTKTRKGYQSYFKDIYDFPSFDDLKYDGHSLGAQSESDTYSIALKLSSWQGGDGDLWCLDTITNDFKRNIPIGTLDDYNAAEPSALTYYGALRIFRNKILELSGSTVAVILSNATHRNNSGYTSSSTNTVGCKLIDYSNAAMCVAEIEGWNFVDVFNFGGIFDDNLNMTTIDGLHPNNLGYKLSVKPWLEQLEILYEIL